MRFKLYAVEAACNYFLQCNKIAGLSAHHAMITAVSAALNKTAAISTVLNKIATVSAELAAVLVEIF